MIRSLWILLLLSGLGFSEVRAQQKLFLSVRTPGRILEYDLTSSQTDTVATGNLLTAQALAVDTVHKKLYWTNMGQIEWSNLDGSGRQILAIPGLGFVISIVVDYGQNRLIWVDNLNGKIMESGLDGSDPAELTGSANPSGLALDCSGNIYWGNAGVSGMIFRMNPDGTQPTALVEDLETPGELAFDCAAQKLYWTDDSAQKIQSAQSDGSNVQTIHEFSGNERPYAIELDPALGKLYWTDYGIDSVRRSNLTGGAVENLPVPVFNDPTGIALYREPPVAAPEAGGAHSGIRMFPNPAGAWVCLEREGQRSGSFSGTIVALTSRVVRQFDAPAGRLDLALEDLAPGMYLVRILDAGRFSIRKLLVR